MGVGGNQVSHGGGGGGGAGYQVSHTYCQVSFTAWFWQIISLDIWITGIKQVVLDIVVTLHLMTTADSEYRKNPIMFWDR